MNPSDLQQHAIATLIPPMSDEEFNHLKEDIQTHGFSSEHDIVLFEEKILDGYSRHLACLEVGVRANYKQFIAPDMADTALDFVIQENLHRRHLTTGQRASIADQLAEMAMQRKLDEDESTLNSNTRTLTNPTIEKSIETAAETMNVSKDSVRKVRALKKSDPKAAAEVQAGKKTIHAAKTASENKNAAHGAAVKRIEAVLGESWVAKTQLKHKDLVEMSGLVPDEMKRLRPYLESGWKLKAALGYQATSLTAGHSIRNLYERAIEHGKYVLLIDGWEISVRKEKP